MLEMNYLAVVAATAAAFVVSIAWYIVFDDAMMKLQLGAPSLWNMG